MILGFSTGLDSFMNPSEIGPMYPFPDIEWLFVAIGVVLWLLWHAGQIKEETDENEESRATVEALGIERVMYYGGSAVVPTDQEWAEAGRHGYPGATGPGGYATGGVPPAGTVPPPGEPPPPPPAAPPPPPR